MLQAQHHERTDDELGEQELARVVLHDQAADDGHVDQEVREDGLEEDAPRALGQLAVGQGGEQVVGSEPAKLAGLPEHHRDDDRANEVEHHRPQDDPRGPQPGDVPAHHAEDHEHHGAGRQFGTDLQDHGQADKEAHAEDDRTETRGDTFDRIAGDDGEGRAECQVHAGEDRAH